MPNSPHSLSVISSPAGLASEEPPQFIAVSAVLRRLLLQAEITAPRLHIAALEGEAGTGKHLLAQTIHRRSELAHLPFHRIDAREWLADEASLSTLTGILYLDRVDLLSPGGQSLLLNTVKILQNDAVVPPRFVLLVSSHSALRQLAGRDLFLPDLAFRLAAVRFSLPPLRAHREDIAPIAQSLIERICRRYRQSVVTFAPGTLSCLLQHPWPGNVRELASILESAILESSAGILRSSDLALSAPHETAAIFPDPATGLPEDLTLDAAIRRHIQLVLHLNHSNKLRAARQLGISRSTLYRLLAAQPSSTHTIL